MNKVKQREVMPREEERPQGDRLIVEGLRQNNLKNISLAIPHDQITAVVGPSGSGKSSLAFDTLFAEGRWRFMESLSTYTRLFLEKMERPDLDAIHNIRPAIAVEQKNPVRTSRSTVGTASEINDYIRLLFSRVGALYCTDCGVEIKPDLPAQVAETLAGRFTGLRAVLGFTVRPAREARDPGGKDWDELLESLVSRGFTRLRVRSRIIDLSERRPSTRGLNSVDVVLDRVVLKPESVRRLTDSLEAAYREGGDAAWVAVEGRRLMRFSGAPRCPSCGRLRKRPSPLDLSFNHPVGACPACKGFGNVLVYDYDKIIPDQELSLREGAIEPWTKPSYRWLYEELEEAAGQYGIDLDRPYEDLPEETKTLLHEGAPGFEGIDEFFEGLERKKYKLHIKVFTSRYKSFSTCRVCDGRRLNAGALCLRLGGMDIAEVNAMSIDEAREFFASLPLGKMENEIAGEALAQIRTKLDFLHATGLGYISLSRPTKTLSGGEVQRVTLATQLASALTGVLYVLDEPSVGLHPLDIEALITQMKALRDRGNTVVVVEHDTRIINNADYIVELGPGSGEAGGRAVYTGTMHEFISRARTLTSDYLTGRASIPVPRWRRGGTGRQVVIEGASGNNLRDVTLSLPLGTLTCVTGVSGSGKSTLIIETLYRALARRFGTEADRPLPYRALHGAGAIRGLKLVDQEPIGRSQRSIPVTYIGAFDAIRKIYASRPLARASGLTAGHFSFNVPGGRCETCRGEGAVKMDMYFLPDVYITCRACKGRRFGRKALNIKYRGLDISEVLGLTFDEAARIMGAVPELRKKFSVMLEVGLGYLRLGQPATTLSGGEAQRIKIARELLRGGTRDTLFILDEPTRGLHTDDIRKLISLLGQLVDNGNTVLVIEHNMEVVKTADFVIDLGPGSGPQGGRIVASGTPESLARARESRTAPFLAEALGE